MSTLIQQLAFRWLSRVETVPVAECVHFAGFGYGRGTINPYENYVSALVRGEPVKSARSQFIEFLQHYRPRHLGEVFGVRLEREYPLWSYPWSRRKPLAAWRTDPGELPDIITYYSDAGIQRSRIEEEFGWLERCLHSIQTHGYLPEQYVGHPQVRRLVGVDGEARYIVHDGNHRLAVLGALKEPTVKVRQVPVMTVLEQNLMRWPGVMAGRFTVNDAQSIFKAYFAERKSARTTEVAATVID